MRVLDYQYYSEGKLVLMQGTQKNSPSYGMGYTSRYHILVKAGEVNSYIYPT